MKFDCSLLNKGDIIHINNVHYGSFLAQLIEVDKNSYKLKKLNDFDQRNGYTTLFRPKDNVVVFGYMGYSERFENPKFLELMDVFCLYEKLFIYVSFSITNSKYYYIFS